MPDMKYVAEKVAETMMGHFENPIESPYDFFEEDVADWIDENIDDMYSEKSREFRQEVLNSVKKQLQL